MDWKEEADNYNVALAKCKKILFTPKKFLYSKGPLIYNPGDAKNDIAPTIDQYEYVDQAGYNDVECDSYSGWDGCPYKYYKKAPQQRGWNGDPNSLTYCERYSTRLKQSGAIDQKVDEDSDMQNQYFETVVDGANHIQSTDIPQTNSHYSMIGTDPEAQVGNLPEYVPDCNRNALFLGFCPPLPRKYNHVQVLTDSWKGVLTSTCFEPGAPSLPQAKNGCLLYTSDAADE